MDPLVESFCSGDESAIRELYARYSGAISTVARSIVRDAGLVDEVVQQTFLKAWRSSSSFDPTRELAPWLYSIARRTAIDTLRREQRPTTGDHEPETDQPVTGIGFDQVYEAFEVRRAVDTLPPDERTVVELSHRLGLTHAEIAEQLAIPLGTVKSRSARAHGRLVRELSHLRTEKIETIENQIPISDVELEKEV